jgi:hypothetical protein
MNVETTKDRAFSATFGRGYPPGKSNLDRPRGNDLETHGRMSVSTFKQGTLWSAEKPIAGYTGGEFCGNMCGDFGGEFCGTICGGIGGGLIRSLLDLRLLDLGVMCEGDFGVRKSCRKVYNCTQT